MLKFLGYICAQFVQKACKRLLHKEAGQTTFRVSPNGAVEGYFQRKSKKKSVIHIECA